MISDEIIIDTKIVLKSKRRHRLNQLRYLNLPEDFQGDSITYSDSIRLGIDIKKFKDMFNCLCVKHGSKSYEINLNSDRDKKDLLKKLDVFPVVFENLYFYAFDGLNDLYQNFKDFCVSDGAIDPSIFMPKDMLIGEIEPVDISVTQRVDKLCFLYFILVLSTLKLDFPKSLDYSSEIQEIKSMLDLIHSDQSAEISKDSGLVRTRKVDDKTYLYLDIPRYGKMRKYLLLILKYLGLESTEKYHFSCFVYHVSKKFQEYEKIGSSRSLDGLELLVLAILLNNINVQEWIFHTNVDIISIEDIELMKYISRLSRFLPLLRESEVEEWN